MADWIACSERLPAEGNYLVGGPGWSCEASLLAMCSGNPASSWLTHWSEWRRPNGAQIHPTHWQPLPPPPEPAAAQPQREGEGAP